jgi:anti-anti-sigma factor
MTAVAIEADADRAPDVEISTVLSDATRAEIRVVGELDGAAAVLLHEVVDGHVRAGRRFLRLDLSGVRLVSDAGAATLAGAHDRLLARRGTVILTGVDSALRQQFHEHGLAERLLIIAPTAAESN